MSFRRKVSGRFDNIPLVNIYLGQIITAQPGHSHIYGIALVSFCYELRVRRQRQSFHFNICIGVRLQGDVACLGSNAPLHIDQRLVFHNANGSCRNRHRRCGIRHLIRPDLGFQLDFRGRIRLKAHITFGHNITVFLQVHLSRGVFLRTGGIDVQANQIAEQFFPNIHNRLGQRKLGAVKHMGCAGRNIRFSVSLYRAVHVYLGVQISFYDRFNRRRIQERIVVFCRRPQNHITALVIRFSLQAHAGKICVRNYVAAGVNGIHQVGKVYIFISPQPCAFLNIDVGSAQQHAAAGVHLTLNDNFAFWSQLEAL